MSSECKAGVHGNFYRFPSGTVLAIGSITHLVKDNEGAGGRLTYRDTAGDWNHKEINSDEDFYWLSDKLMSE